ncbi:HK97 family phage prohead protease [Chelativorans alearense]|uniref:HK97 family phage prohead protease n=1 Tax=Chelativorans alearense TaxID=2681495 RepID=UPI0013CFBDA5|nr:HK97 family phage prohead protease [Chelativorans alearense]
MTIEQIVASPEYKRLARRSEVNAQMAASMRPGISGMMFANRQESQFERPAIRGIACRYHEVFTHEGKLTTFVAGCFKDSLARGQSVKLQLEHDEAIVLADSGLRFFDTEEGLVFEYEVPRNQAGAIISSLVASGSRTDVSVGTRNLKSTTRNIRGHDVRLITSADLEEISLCTDGLVALSHARVVDLESALSLEDEASGSTLRFIGRCNDLKTASKRFSATLDRLSQPPKTRAYTAQDFW